MILKIKSNEDIFFRQILEVMRSFPPLNELRSRELDVLSRIMYYNNKYITVPEDIRWRIINDTETRREIQEYLNISEQVLNNNVSILRKAGLISKGNKLAKFLHIVPNNDFSITFEFKID